MERRPLKLFSVEPMPQPAPELYVFGDHRQAAAARFRDGRHVQHRWMRAFHLATGDVTALRGLLLARIVITPAAHEMASHSARARDTLLALRDLGPALLRQPPAIWMEF